MSYLQDEVWSKLCCEILLAAFFFYFFSLFRLIFLVGVGQEGVVLVINILLSSVHIMSFFFFNFYFFLIHFFNFFLILGGCEVCGWWFPV